MPRKKVDARIRTLIENGVKVGHRSLFVIVGDRGKEAVVNLHYILSKARVKAQPNVLWCYKKELGFSTHRQKRMRQVKKMVQRGLYNPDKDNPFDLFLATARVRWTYYKETENILGQTFGMCVLQDFEALTPNILCRTIETVEGGGCVVILLKTMASLKQLYTMTMDVHARFRTESHHDVVARFNERFLLSLSSCSACLLLDDELNVLPTSQHARSLVPVVVDEDETPAGAGAGGTGSVLTPLQVELAGLKEAMASTPLVGVLTRLAKTCDQAKAVLCCAEVLSEKSLRGVVAITAGRGRGKSAALGLSIAAAVGYGYSNIFVTAPHPDNLKTVFEFLFKGFDALAYKEHIDYEAIASTNPEFNKAIVRVNVFRDHRQTVQYIQPHDSDKLAQAELVVIDEAAAIPLPLVRKLLVSCVVFMASTVNGYEGTGRSLSLKLISQLRKQSVSLSGAVSGPAAGAGGASSFTPKKLGSKPLQEVELSEPIRYNPNDPVEAWLTQLMCLDSTTPHRLTAGLPPPKDCEMFYVDRDALFSYHKMSETFLQRLMSLFVSSHYKNSPNDLQLMSDAPAHMLFVLLGPVSPASADLPDILCAAQVCLEGEISRESVQAALSRGQRANGDLIPWTLAQQFQENDFPTLSGARVVRIATHPDATRLGYGSVLLQRLQQYFTGEFVSLTGDSSSSDSEDEEKSPAAASASAPSPSAVGAESVLATERVKPRKQLPPLLVALSDRKPERLHWFGVSYGVTLELFNFWQRAGYVLVYLRQTSNDLTGEHTAIMLHDLTQARARSEGGGAGAGAGVGAGWLHALSSDFSRRLVNLFSYAFRDFDPYLALSVVENGRLQLQAGEEGEAAATGAGAGAGAGPVSGTHAHTRELGREADVLSAAQLSFLLTMHDLKRLEAYSRNLVDYHMIVDLLPVVTRLFFTGKLPAEVHLSRLQACILLAVGGQCITIDTLAARLDLPVNQLLAYFNKAMRKITNSLLKIQESVVSAELTLPRPARTSGPLLAASTAEFEESAWQEALAPLARKLTKRGDGNAAVAEAASDENEARATVAVPSVLSVKKLVPVALPRPVEEDGDGIEGRHKGKHGGGHKRKSGKL